MNASESVICTTNVYGEAVGLTLGEDDETDADMLCWLWCLQIFTQIS